MAERKNPSLHLFFKTFFETVKTQSDALFELQNTFCQFSIADTDENNVMLFEDSDAVYKLKGVVSDKRSVNFINSIDDASKNKRTDSDHIREIIYVKVCMNGFKVIEHLAEYFTKNCTFSSEGYDFIEAFCNDSFTNEANKREAINFLTAQNEYLKTAWAFIFLCFPKTPSEKNTDYRLLLLKKILQSQNTGKSFKVLDITNQEQLIEKVNSSIGGSTDQEQLIGTVNYGSIGREKEFEEIKREMLANHTVLVYGIGGIGKSYLCRKIFWNYHDHFSDGIEYLAWIQYNGTLMQSFVNAFYRSETNLDRIRKEYESHPVIGDMFVKLALTEKQEDKLQVIREYLNKLCGQILVFVDNADTMSQEEKKWLNTCKCRMIITSRQRIDGFYPVYIGSPSPEYCKDIYFREIWLNNPESFSQKDEGFINRINELANYHTQTVVLISKAQVCLGLSSEEMLEELQNSGFMLRESDETIEAEDYELTMAEHLTKLFNMLNITDETQIKTLRLFSLLAPNTPIKKRDIKKWFGLKSLSSVNELVKFGWLTGIGSEFVSIHPVIADVVKYNYKPDFEYALSLIEALQEEMKAASDYIKRNAVIVHSVAVAMEFNDKEAENYADLLYEIASTYFDLADYSNSEAYHIKALTIRESTIGEEHSDTAISYNDIAEIHKDLGAYDQALIYYKKAYLIFKSVFGMEHQYTAIACNGIGSVYKYKKDYDKALKYYNMAFTIRKKIYGLNHPDIANSLNNLGVLYGDIGNYSESLKMHEKAVLIREKALGCSHPDTASSYNNIGFIYTKLENYDTALEMFFKAVSIKEKTFGISHPDTAITYTNIGITNKLKGEYDIALDYLKSAFTIFREYLGEDHFRTLIVKKNIEEIEKLLSNNN